MSQTGTVRNLLKAAEKRFLAVGIETAKLDAEILFAHIAGCGTLELYTRTVPVNVDTTRLFEEYVSRRETLEPVAYITGEQDFWSLTLKVNEHVLIPRPDTETLIEAVLKRASSANNILDLGTGSGCILLSLLSEYETAQGTGVDISDKALEVARENARVSGLLNRSTFIKSNWFKSVTAPAGGFDVIVSNPPYIPAADIDTLMADVRDHEPIGALDGGPDGLAPYRTLLDSIDKYIAPGGLLAVEIGIGQEEDVVNIFSSKGLQDIEVYKDLSGVCRVISGKSN